MQARHLQNDGRLLVAPRGDPSIRNAGLGALNKVGGVLRISRYARILLSIYLSLTVVAPEVVFECCSPILEPHSHHGFENTVCIMVRLKFRNDDGARCAVAGYDGKSLNESHSQRSTGWPLRRDTGWGKCRMLLMKMSSGDS